MLDILNVEHDTSSHFKYLNSIYQYHVGLRDYPPLQALASIRVTILLQKIIY